VNVCEWMEGEADRNGKWKESKEEGKDVGLLTATFGLLTATFIVDMRTLN
jgi:hypothetical protein